MTTQCSSELCMLLIEDNFGELFARIFTVLQRYERLTLPRLKFYSRLTDRQLNNGISAMIQHHLVYHFTSVEENNTYYEANPQAAYYLVRSGKILQHVDNRLGEYAAKVMEAIMFLGHTSITHLETLPQLQPNQPLTNGVNYDEERPETNGETNGDHEEEASETNGDHAVSQKPARLHPTLKSLASHGYIHRVREGHFQSPNDNWLDCNRIVSSRPDVKAMKGKQQQAEIEEKSKNMVKERTEGDLSRGLMFNGLPQGVKRMFGGASGSTNAQKGTNDVNGDHAEDEEDEGNDWSEDEDGIDSAPMDSNLIVRVNYEKLDVALRNTQILELARQCAPPVSLEIYDCLLRRIEYQTPRCRDTYEIPREGEEGEQYSAPIQLSAIVNDVDPNLDLTGCIGPMNPTPTSNRRKRPLDDGTNGVNGDDHEDESTEVNRAYQIDQHLSYLSQAPFNLTTKHNIGGLDTWRIAFRGIARKLRHLELERMIESRYGDVALRVIRVLHAKGRLDEKRLQEISLLPFKDLRQTLASMQTGGFVDLQEVPRDAQRQPSKTIYLWYYDPDRVCSSILEDTYKAMSRCLQRIKFEREREKDFLEKTERTDVKGHEEEFLSEAELEHLRNWKAKEALLLAEVSRLDDMVAVFRDY
ncbi:hypothetical protein PENANT_c034G11765 [Penicillium antarcticum]|uniref:DNA-directed RNA polymerase III subunit RPC3 n=1 Tax=Penicillium antarcticum TaxID=416450 RepID=A0A1V6PV88_9EURO|nr:uncharacterized protein N7508_001831 [Penicillium antarcticum]KAJ5317323.1 hypothetical protein N7508_001831 [Penicillium antarcticum]OQD80622.1 hypothetical protein PENANT_c034G11765 [Penicillium antarcticum]